MADLHLLDYAVFIFSLLLALCIGLFCSFWKGRHKSTDEYLLGNRKMSVIPVTLSYTVSFMSTILLLGWPADLYVYGANIVMLMFGIILGGLLCCLIFIPVLHPLRLTSVNEYLEYRYHSKLVKSIGSFCAIGSMSVYAAIVFYGPSTAIEAVSGFPAWLAITVGGLVTIIFTAMGGYKGVVWVDVVQSVIMLLGLIAIIVQGVISVGDISLVYELNQDWDRLDIFNFDIDPTTRISLWGAVIGKGTTYMGLYGYTQPGFQRYSSLPTKKKAILAALGTIPCNLVLCCLASLAGWVVFAYYSSIGCDPLEAEYISNINQIVSYFVADVFQYPGLVGLFLASISAASLSTASSCLNSCAANAWEDVIKPLYPGLKDNRHGASISRLCVIFFGVLTTTLAFCILQLGGTMVQIISTLQSFFDGPTMGLFIAGVFLPWINWLGISVGSLVGFGVGLWISVGSYIYDSEHDRLESPVHNCSVNSTQAMNSSIWNSQGSSLIMAHNSSIDVTVAYTIYGTTSPQDNIHNSTSLSFLHYIYSISFTWLAVFNCIIVLMTALLVSLCTKCTAIGRRDYVEAKYVHPLVRRCCNFEEDEDDLSDIEMDVKQSPYGLKGTVSLESLQRLYSEDDTYFDTYRRIQERDGD